MEDTPTVENGGLLKTEYTDVFKFNPNKQLSNRYSKFFLDLTFNNIYNIREKIDLLYYNNLQHIWIVPYDTIVDNTLRDFIDKNKTHKDYSITINFSGILRGNCFSFDDKIKCNCCKGLALKCMNISGKTYNFCSIKCQQNYKQ